MAEDRSSLEAGNRRAFDTNDSSFGRTSEKPPSAIWQLLLCGRKDKISKSFLCPEMSQLEKSSPFHT